MVYLFIAGTVVLLICAVISTGIPESDEKTKVAFSFGAWIGIAMMIAAVVL